MITDGAAHPRSLAHYEQLGCKWELCGCPGAIYELKWFWRIAIRLLPKFDNCVIEGHIIAIDPFPGSHRNFFPVLNGPKRPT